MHFQESKLNCVVNNTILGRHKIINSVCFIKQSALPSDLITKQDSYHESVTTGCCAASTTLGNPACNASGICSTFNKQWKFSDDLSCEYNTYNLQHSAFVAAFYNFFLTF